jgi:hypothetical protein
METGTLLYTKILELSPKHTLNSTVLIWHRQYQYVKQLLIILLLVETPRKFITAKLSIRKPGSSSVLIICLFPQTKVLYVLQPCKPTKNLS